jgi:hypothetical protein
MHLTEGITMKLAICFGLLLAATAAQAETYTTTVSPDRHSVTTTGPSGSATTQISRNGNVMVRTTTFSPNGTGPSGY